MRPLLFVQAFMHVDERAAWLQAAASPDSCTNLSLDPSCRSAAVSAELVPLLLFSSNDYIGLSAHPAVKSAAAEAAAQVGGSEPAPQSWLNQNTHILAIDYNSSCVF
jgi:7-keto-8-aminopelargonate synthetase-like enzyme